MKRAFRFGVVTAQASSGTEWVDRAKRIESLGFHTLVIPDGLRYTYSPFVALAAAATATTALRIGTYVIANDYRHPVMLAKEAATLDVLSGGRLELGIGAGRPSAEADNAMLGLGFDSGGTRLDRLSAALSIIKPLLAGETVTRSDSFYRCDEAAVSPLPLQQPLPLMIAGGQQRMLRLAAREADIIALGVGPDATEAVVTERIRWIRDAAGERFPDIELNLNLMAVAGKLPRYLQMTLGENAARLAGSDAVPILKGSLDQMSERLESLREQLGISYIMVGDELIDEFAPVVARLSGR
ncbi:MAG TPA: TIGR03621 family F420-dependent LLM class oxidoreductase [Nitrolancea sp.]|nr:TIGR03621 family F420-dependent LLM class oxidoreductase [Nitrolancea sp.]